MIVAMTTVNKSLQSFLIMTLNISCVLEINNNAMKNFLLFPFLIATLHMNAQTRFGVQAGVIASRSKISGTNDLDKYSGSPQALVGYKFGFLAEIKVKSNVYFSPEINYLGKGSKYSNRTVFSNNNIIEVKRTIKTEYIEVPLNVFYKFRRGDGFVFAGGGPVIGFGLNGKEESSMYYSTVPMIVSFKGDIKFDGKENSQSALSHFNLVELGFNATAGYEFKSGIRFNIQFRPNFNDIAPGTSKKYRNMYFGLT